MKIVLGSDHRGFECKMDLLRHLQALGLEVEDLGCHSAESCDYPTFAARVASAVAEGRADRGILICGTGIGMSIAANKVPGIRAALCHDEVTAEISRRHNDANVLCLAGDMANPRSLRRVVEVWVRTPFEGGRHARRLRQVECLEKGQDLASCPPVETGQKTDPP